MKADRIPEADLQDDTRLRVLLVDDDTRLRQSLSKYLHDQYGYRVETAADGDEAMERVAGLQGRCDVALIDQVLSPGKDGIQVMQEIRKDFPEVECILFTGYGAESRQQALQAGAFRYLEKPFDNDELALLIRTAAQQVRMRAISRAILGKHQLSQVLSDIIQAACSLSLAEEAAITLLEQPSNRLSVHDFPIYSIETRWRKHLKGSSLSRRIIQTGKITSFRDIRGDDRIHPDFAATQLRSFIGIPIPGEGETLGVLYAYSWKPNHFDDWGTTALLQTLAGQAGLAIANARAFEQVRAHAGYMDALVRGGQGLNRSARLEDQLSLAWDFVREQLQVCTFFIALYDQPSGILRFPIAYDQGQAIAIPSRAVNQNSAGWGVSEYVIKKGAELVWFTQSEGEALCTHLKFRKILAGSPPQPESCFYLPLKLGGQTIGVISIQSSEHHAFSPVLLDAFRALGSQLAVALENTHLLEAARRVSDQLIALDNAVLKIEKEQDPQALLRQVVEHAVTLLSVQGGAVYLLDPNRENLTMTAALGIPEQLRDLHIRKGEGISGEILRTGQAFQVNNYSGWKKRLKALDGFHLEAVAGAPIGGSEHLLGTLIVQDTRPGKHFSENDLKLLQQLASHAGLAMQKVRLLDKLRAIQSLAASITAIHSLSEVLNRACQAAVELFGADHSGLVLFDPDLQWGTVRGEFPPQVDTLNQRIPTGQMPATVRLAKEGLPLVYHDVEAVQPELGPVLETFRRFNIRSIAIVPILYQGRALGSFSLDAIGRKRAFTAEEINLCQVLASQLAVALENASLFARIQQREQLLAAEEEAARHIRAEKQTIRLLHEIVRLAAELLNSSAGGLFINYPHLGVMELIVTYGLPVGLKGQRIPHTEGLAGQVAQRGCTLVENRYADWEEGEQVFAGCGLMSAVGVPLRQDGEVEAVLFIADRLPEREFTELEAEILERFAAHAAIALRTSRLLSSEKRRFIQLSILHKISDTIQSAGDLEKILNIVLTGVTAGYGLGFNRAALFLVDPKRESLVGRMGIGHIDEALQKEDWAQYNTVGPNEFNKYLYLLETKQLPLTPVGERIRDLHIPIRSQEFDHFVTQLVAQRCLVVDTEDLESFPHSFIAAYEPTTPILIAPLLARNQLIGLLVADNKFSREPITFDDREALLVFANSAAIAIDNHQLFQETRAGEERLLSFYAASNALVSSQDLDQVLGEIVEQARQAAGANGVSMILIESSNHIRQVITAGVDKPENVVSIIRSNGLSMHVIETGEPEIIENTELERERLNPSVFWHNIAAALCMPVSLEGERIGVVWFHYDRPRQFAQTELTAAQLYVNQAALAFDSSRRIRELEYIGRTAEDLSGAASLGEVLNQVVRRATEVLEADSAAILTYDDVHDRFIIELSVSFGILPELWEKSRAEKTRMGGTAFRIMDSGWVGVTDISEAKETNFIGKTTREFLSQCGVQSFQAIALNVGEEKLGVLFVNYNRRRSFHRREQQIAHAFANHAALAVKKARLLEQLNKSRNNARLVAEVTNLGDITRTLNLVVESSLDALNCDAVTLYSYNQDNREIGYPPAMAGIQDEAGVKRFGQVAEGSIIRKMLQVDHVHLSEDTQNDEQLKGPFIKREAIKSAAVIPLVVGNRRVGVMFVNYRTTHHFTSDELTNIELYANQAAVAIRNAQLFQDEQRYRKALYMIQETSAAVSAVLELGRLLPLIAEKAAQIFDAPATSLMLWDKNGENLVIEASFGLNQTYCEEQKIPRRRVDALLNRLDSRPLFFNLHDQSLGNPELVESENLYTVLAAPLLVDSKITGVLNVYSKGYARQFDEKEQEWIKILASHAALAIKNARLYEEKIRRAEVLRAVNEAGTAVTGSLALDEILTRIVQQARSLGSHWDRPAAFSQLALLDGDKLRFRAAYPPDHLPSPQGGIREIDLVHDIKIGVTGRAVVEGRSQRVDNVSLNADYITFDKKTRSELAVPIRRGDDIIGVINVESHELEAFNEDDQLALEALAVQAAIALQNAQAYDELKKAKGLIGGRTALAWMGMASSTWSHSIIKHAQTIKEQVMHIRTDLEQHSPESGKKKLGDRIKMIERLANKILEKPIVLPLSSEAGLEAVQVNSLVSERARQLWLNDPYKRILLEMELMLSSSAVVWASPEWLRRALDILIDNAVEAVTGQERQVITIGTRQAGEVMEILITDNGPGIPPEIRDRVGLDFIKKPEDAIGLGMGLLMAQTIAQTYNGEILVKDTGATGTTLCIRLPLKTL